MVVKNKAFFKTLIWLLFSFSPFLLITADETKDQANMSPENEKAVSQPKKLKKKSVKKKAPLPNATTAPLTTTTAAPPSPKKKTRESLQAWLQKMKKGVARSQAKHNQLVSVAAVRGHETPDSPPLYWKGKKSKGSVSQQELTEFDEALETALTGDSTGAVSKLQSFVSTYPQSVLVPDANQTLKMLQESSANP